MDVYSFAITMWASLAQIAPYHTRGAMGIDEFTQRVCKADGDRMQMRPPLRTTRSNTSNESGDAAAAGDEAIDDEAARRLPDLSPEIVALMERGWSADPALRPTFDEVKSTLDAALAALDE